MSDSVQPQRRQPTRLPRPWDSPGKNTGVGCHFLLQCIKGKSEVTQSCPTLRNPMDCSPPGSSVHGILQARILEWVAYPFSGGSSRPRNPARVSCIAGRFFTTEPPHPPSQILAPILDLLDTHSSAQTSKKLRPGFAGNFSHPFPMGNARSHCWGELKFFRMPGST